MARYGDIGVTGLSFKADQDLSDYQFYCVAAASTTDYVKLGSGASDSTPFGVNQSDGADTVGDALTVVMFGPTQAVVCACDIAGNASPIGFGDFLSCGSGGALYRSGSFVVANALSLGTVTSGSNTIPIWWLGLNSSCSVAAS